MPSLSNDWGSCSTAILEAHQSLRYEYPGPIEDLHQALMLVPPDRLDGQLLLSYDVAAVPDARPRYHTDQYGNRICTIVLPRVEQTLELAVVVRVERWPTNGASARSEGEAGLFLLPSPLAESTDSLRAAASAAGADDNYGLSLAGRINDWVHHHLVYRPGGTDFRTPAGAALRLGAGVCQDYAHVMIAMCRIAGLPARYVSGHLLGQGAMHAWTQVLVPSDDPAGSRRTWRSFDPTHGTEAGMPYITIAIGRDYTDVSPTRGTFRAAYAGRLAQSDQRATVVSLS
ncbi:MAG TPA: transglutaminase family protein [Dehalococcoidia bacterium]|nr:transglutaminase family protein [Dehalococcoidia bacterium]